MSFGILGAQKPTDAHLLSIHMPEALQDVFNECYLDGSRHFPGFAHRPCKDVVIFDPVLELFHEPERFALNDLASP